MNNKFKRRTLSLSLSLVMGILTMFLCSQVSALPIEINVSPMNHLPLNQMNNSEDYQVFLMTLQAPFCYNIEHNISKNGKTAQVDLPVFLLMEERE